MVGEKNKDIKPTLLKFGKEGEVDPGLRPQRLDDLNATRKPHSLCNASTASEQYEETYAMICVGNCTSSFSPCSKHGGLKDGLPLPVFDDVAKEFDIAAGNSGFSPKRNAETPSSNVNTPKAYRTSEMYDNEHELRNLRNTVRMLRERERSLEVRLLEYYGLTEQETAVMELRNQLKIKGMEAKLFTLNIESLQAENRRLEAQVADHAKVVAELEATRAKIKVLKKKLRFEKFHDSEAADGKSEIQLKLRRLKDVEDEAEELRKSNLRLQLQNSELARRLESTQILANSILEDPEAGALKEVSERLRQENEDLTKEIQQLQVDRCTDVEELVYLRWINAVEYANTEGMEYKGMHIDFDSDQWSTSQASFFTNSPEFDDFSLDNSPAAKTNASSKSKLFNKLRRLVRGKYSTPQQNQTSSTDKPGYAEENNSPYCSSVTSTAVYVGPEGHSNTFANSSHNSSRASLDLPRWRSPKEQDLKYIHNVQRHSDVGSSSGYKTFGREGFGDLPPIERSDQDSDSMEKGDLVKYAEALMSSRNATPKVHRKSASAS